MNIGKTIKNAAGISLGTVGVSDENAEREALRQAVRESRLRAARSTPAWQQLDDDLVARGRRFISAGSDAVYKAARGTVFSPGSASVVAEKQPLFYVVDQAGGLTFYEKEPLTWTQMCEQRAERKARRTAPRKLRLAR